MPRTKTGHRALIATLTEIMTNPESTVVQKLEACKILAGLQIKPVQKTKETKLVPVKKSTLLG